MLTVVLQFWFWLTPIFITEDRYTAGRTVLLLANPLYYVVRAYRFLLLTHSLPDLGDLAIGHGLWGGGLHPRRAVFPLHEARIRGRTVGRRTTRGRGTS